MGKKSTKMGTGPRAIARAPGRPAGDTETRDRLLEIALHEFSTHGLRGATVTAIAKAAGATPAMVHHYFGNKQGLYEAVLKQALGPILARLQAATENPPEDEDLLPKFVHGYMRLLAENPEVPSLIVRDVLSPDGQMRDIFVQGIAGRGAPELRELVKRAQNQGRLRADLDPDLAALSLLSMVLFPFLGRPVAGQVLDYTLDPERIDALAEHTLQLFYSGASV